MDDYLKEFARKYNEGVPKFNKLFNLKSNDIKLIIKDLLINDIQFDFDNCFIIKTIENDKPKEITLLSYNSIRINPYSIDFYPEYGESIKLIYTMYLKD